MNNQSKIWHYLFALILLLNAIHFDANAQGCDPSTPTFTINLSGRPDSVWTSSATIRSGNCCGTSAPDKCIEFILTLDSNSSGIRLDIPTGALPGGALFYQIGCGTSYQVGQDICLSGPGPHRITFCKPGNNTNTYQIRSIPKPDLTGRLIINEACRGHLKAVGLVTSSITWQSVPNNTTYNSYLSCQSNCDSVSITPTGAYPSTVTYRVCGTVAGGCGAAATFCDTATVRFVSNIGVDILPLNPTVCFGGSNTTITANPSGGLAPFRYLWSTNDTSQSIQVGVGTYYVQMLDSLQCTIARDTVVVTSFASTIDVNAGNDTTVCRNLSTVSLNGTTTGGVGVKWKLGLGTFSPNDTTKNATYTPSASEIALGTITLRAITTRNGSCPADSDLVQITIALSPPAIINGPASVCALKQTTHTTTFAIGNTYLWTATNGSIQGNTTDTSVKVIWNNVASGTLTLKVTNSNGCDSTVVRNIIINPSPIPVINGPTSVCALKQTTHTTTFASGNTYLWTATNGTIQGNATDTSVKVIWNNVASGTLTLKITNSNSCDSTVVKSIIINPSPIPVISGPANVCALKQTIHSTTFVLGSSYLWTATNGTIQGTNSDTSVKVIWNNVASGSISLKVINSNSCDSIVVKSIIINPSPIPVINGPTSVCALKQTTHTTTFASGNTYLWTATNGTIQGNSSDTAVKVNWNNVASGTLTLKVTNSNGCDSTVVKSIIINPSPIPVINGPTSVCALKQTTHSTAFATGNTYLWTATNGTILGNNTDTTVKVIWNNVASGTLTLKVTNSNNCDSTVVKNIIINPSPIPVINGPTSVCALKQTTHTTTFVSGNTYLWTATNGTIQGNNTDTTVKVIWSNVASGTLSLKVTNSNGCDSTVVKSIIINPSPIPVINGPTSVCALKQTTHTTTFVSGNTYLWTATNGTIQGNNTDTTVKVIWSNVASGTLSLKVTNINGCDSTVVKSIIINPSPIPVINGPTAVCALKQTTHSTAFATGNTYLWTATNGTIQGSNIDTSVKVIWSNVASGTLSVRITNSNGCDSTVVKSIIINPSPIPVINGPASVCALKQTTHTTTFVSGSSYLWTATNGTIQGNTTDTSVKVIWNNVASGTLTLKVTNSNSCDSTVVKSIIINPSPIPVINGPTGVCALKQTTHTTTFVSGSSYLWTVTNGTIQGNTTDTAVKVIWSNVASGTLTLKVTNSNGCDSTVVKSIIINQIISNGIIGDTNTCERRTYTYYTNKNSGDLITWNVTGGVILETVADTMIRANWPTIGNGSVSMHLVNSFGCDSTYTKNITVYANPRVTINGNTQICEQTQYTFTSSVTGLAKYKWTATNATIIGSDSSSTVVLKSIGINNITLQLFASTNQWCDTLLTKQIIVLPLPVLTLSGPTTSCRNGITTYITKYNSGSTYFWNAINGTITTNKDSLVSVQWPSIGSQKIKVTETSSLGCVKSDSLVVNILGNPPIHLTTIDPICENTTTQVKANKVLNTNINWSVSGAPFATLNDSTIEVYAQTFNIQVSAQRIDLNGCDSTSTKNITLKSKPFPAIVGVSSLCSYKRATYYTTNTSPITYLWSVTNATVLSPNLTDSFIEVEFGNTNATIALQLTNQFGCDSVAQKIVQTLAAPSGLISGDSIVCTNQNPRHYIYTGSTNTSNYQWQAFDGTFITNNTGSEVDMEWTKSGYQQLLVRVYENATGCDSIFYKTIYADSVVKPTVTAGPDKGCLPLTSKLSATNVDGHNYSYKWFTSTEHLGSQSTLTKTYSTAGVNSVWLKVTNNNGCIDSSWADVYVNNKPNADADYIKIGKRIYTEDTVQFVNNSVGGNKHVWHLPSESFDTTAFDWQHLFAHPGTYLVKLIAIDTLSGCLDSDYVNVEIWLKENLYVPNVFSPNNDGYNDFFSVGLENLVEFEVLIVNRWGQIVFQSNDPKFAWDGNFQGKPCQDDAYVYLINATGYHGKTFSLKGNVTIMR